MGEVIVHPRVMERHPEIAEEDVKMAWCNYIRMMRRSGDDDHAVAVGFDGKGRALEMVAKESGGDYLVYHAFTPPTASVLKDLSLIGGRK